MCGSQPSRATKRLCVGASLRATRRPLSHEAVSSCPVGRECRCLLAELSLPDGLVATKMVAEATAPFRDSESVTRTQSP